VFFFFFFRCTYLLYFASIDDKEFVQERKRQSSSFTDEMDKIIKYTLDLVRQRNVVADGQV